ncbi:TOBE domain-containing protein [Methanosarcina horonobensis]|uniref:TOBE domain-containing protein n=1 Tax=Methanosarcina horonobensis TaxID=418008 RepID=UPI000ADF5885
MKSKKSGLVSKLTIEIEPSVLTSVVTEEAVEKLDIKPGDRVYAVIKSTEVMVAIAVGEKESESSSSKKSDLSD